MKYITKIKSHSLSKHFKTVNKTFECSIIELADDIAYATHDLQDALSFELLTLEDFQDVMRNYKESNRFSKLSQIALNLNKKDSNYKANLRKLFADLIHNLISNVFIKVEDEYISCRVKYKAVISDEGKQLLEELNDIVYDKVIKSQRVQTIEWKGGYIVRKLFDAMMNDSDLLLLPRDRRHKNDIAKARVVCDYIAGMTDNYAQNMYSRLYESKSGRLFDI